MKIRFITLALLLFSLSYGCKSSKDSVGSTRTDQIEIDLADKMDPQRLEAGFKSLGITYVCTLNKEENLCVYKFDTSLKTIVEILSFMSNEVGVESASTTKGCPQ